MIAMSEDVRELAARVFTPDANIHGQTESRACGARCSRPQARTEGPRLGRANEQEANLLTFSLIAINQPANLFLA